MFGLAQFGLAQFGLAQSGWACLFEATESERQGGVYCRVMCCFRFMYLRGRALKSHAANYVVSNYLGPSLERDVREEIKKVHFVKKSRISKMVKIWIRVGLIVDVDLDSLVLELSWVQYWDLV
ncbi:hypothetical protein BKA91DRAFT_127941 [Yarrowia lipolytica]|nr:hypothetical protein BKA91DRAFT_127941 [Yarrowia lipolytica]KAE8170985.1 hypothetical protein BKA90DRAFT_130066 [Yarrowia lipolytica]RMI95049.1 hypothetical protein BD777DRAFT_163279 [Yarrowia lipolytica]